MTEKATPPQPAQPPRPVPRAVPLVRLADDDYDGAFDDQPSRYAAAA